MKRIPSFTILELVVAMIISSIVIGIAFTSYSFFLKQFKTYFTKTEKANTIIYFDKCLNHDFFYSDSIVKTSDGFYVFAKQKNIEYKLEDKCIIRISGSLIDSLIIDNLSANFNYESVNSQNTKLVNEFFVEGQSEKKKITFHYFKSYTPDFIINSKLHQWQ